MKIWCTGEDSNLRSSEERQIYSLLPLTTRSPVHSEPLRSAVPLVGAPAGFYNGTLHVALTGSVIRRRAKQTSAQTRLRRFAECPHELRYRQKNTLCAVPSKSEPRQPDAIRRTRSFQLELAKG